MGLRLQLRKQQAEAGDIVLLYGDESEALTHPYLAHAWAKSGADLRVPAPGQAKKVAMLGSLDHVTRQLIVHTSPTKRSSDRPSGATRPSLWTAARATGQADRVGRGQWSDPHQQTHARRLIRRPPKRCRLGRSVTPPTHSPSESRSTSPRRQARNPQPDWGQKPVSPTGFDVKRSSLIATVNAAVGDRTNRSCHRRTRLRGAASGQPLRKRLISSKKRSEAGSCSRNKWFRPGKAMK